MKTLHIKVYYEYNKKGKSMEKPKLPINRLIIEGTIGICPKCHSTEIRKHNFLFLSFGKIIGCIHPKCENYYKNHP